MGRLGLALVLWTLLPCVASGRPSAEDEFLPRNRDPLQVAQELVSAFRADDFDRFDRLVQVPSPPLIRVASILLHPPGRAPSEQELAVVQRIVREAPASSGVAGYVDHWQNASDEARSAERKRWGLSARFHMRLKEGDQAEALALLAEELPSLREARHSQQAVSILSDYADLLVARGEYAAAEQELRLLLARLRAEDRQHEQVNVLRLLALALEGQSPVSDAPEVLQEAQALAERLGLWTDVAAFGRFRGSLAILAGDHTAAESLLQKALATAAAASDASGERVARMAIAKLERSRGRPELAWEHAQRVLEAALRDQDVNRAAEAVSVLVGLSLDAGRLADALRQEGWLEEQGVRATDLLVRSEVLACLGDLALWRGERGAAATFFMGAHAAAQASTAGQRAAVGHLSALLSHGLLSSAEVATYYAAYRKAVEREAHGAWSAWTLAGASRVARKLGDLPTARAFAERAVVASRASSDALARPQGPYALGHVLLAEGKPDEAHLLFEESGRHSAPGSPQAVESRALVGRCLLAAGKPREAIEALRSSLLASAPMRSDVTHANAMRLRSLEHDVAVTGLRAALALRASEPDARDEAAALAWWFRERGAARLLAESIAVGRQAPDASRRADLVASMDAVEGTQRKLIVAIAREDVERQDALRQALVAQYAALHTVVRRGASRTSSPAASPTTSLAELQESLAPDEAVLAYTVGSEDVFGMSVTRDSAHVEHLGNTAEIQDEVAGWKALASTPEGPDELLAARLYDRLVRPLEAQLEDRAVWTVLPEGPLAGIPIDAWIRTSEDDAERLIERHTLCYAHSSGVRSALRERAAGRPAAKGVVALGDPLYPVPTRDVPERAPVLARLRGGVALPRLAASGEEARGVAALYPEAERTMLLGEDATRERLLETLSKRDEPLSVLHIACHAIVDDVLPTLSGLVFTGGDVLTAERLMALHVVADLAVLSACDSGEGERAVGEGVLGLTRALFLSGVSEVICSTWQVADANTAAMMVRLHEQRAREGLSTAEALREARLSLLRDDPTAHPFYWAGLQLWGTGTR